MAELRQVNGRLIAYKNRLKKMIAGDKQLQLFALAARYEKAFTAANLAKEQGFHDSDLTFRVRVKADHRGGGASYCWPDC